MEMESVTLSRAQKSLDIAKKVADNNKQLEDGKEYHINLSLIGAEKDTVQCFSGTVTFKDGVGKISNNLYEHLGMGATLSLKDGNVTLNGQNTQGFAVSSNFNGINIVGREKDEKENMRDLEGNHLKKEDVSLKNSKDAKSAYSQLNDKKFKQKRQEMQDLRAESNALLNKEFQDTLRNMPRLFRMLQFLEDYSYNIADSQARAILMAKGSNYSSTISAMQDLEASHDMLHGYIAEARRINESHCKHYEEELDKSPEKIMLTLLGAKNESGSYSLTKKQFAEMVVNVCNIFCEKRPGTSFEEAQKIMFPSLSWNAQEFLVDEQRREEALKNPTLHTIKRKFSTNRIELKGEDAEKAKKAAWEGMNAPGIRFISEKRRQHFKEKGFHASRTYFGEKPKRLHLTGITANGTSVSFADAIKPVKKTSSATPVEGVVKKNEDISNPPRRRAAIRGFLPSHIHESSIERVKTQIAEKSESPVGEISKKGIPEDSKGIHSYKPSTQEITSANTQLLSILNTPESSASKTSDEVPQTTSTPQTSNISLSKEEMDSITDFLRYGQGVDKGSTMMNESKVEGFIKTATETYEDVFNKSDTKSPNPTTSTTLQEISPLYNRFDIHRENDPRHYNDIIYPFTEVSLSDNLRDIPVETSSNPEASADHTAFDWSQLLDISEQELHHDHNHSHTNEQMSKLNADFMKLEAEVATVVANQEAEVTALDASFDERTLRLVLQHLKHSRDEMRKELYEYSNQLQADKKLTPAKRKQKLALKQEEIKKRQEKELTERLLKQKFTQRQLYVQLLLKHAKVRGTLMKKLDKQAQELKKASTQNTHTPVLDNLSKDAFNHTAEEMNELMDYLSSAIDQAFQSGDSKKLKDLLNLKNRVETFKNVSHLNFYDFNNAKLVQSGNEYFKRIGHPPLSLSKKALKSALIRYKSDGSLGRFTSFTSITPSRQHHSTSHSTPETSANSGVKSSYQIPGYNAETIKHRLSKMGMNPEMVSVLSSTKPSKESLTIDETRIASRNQTNFTNIPKKQIEDLISKHFTNQPPTGPQGPQ